MLVLPLSGGCDVTCGDKRVTLTGRRSVFSRVTDFAYVPRESAVTVRAPTGGRFALPAARAERRLPFRHAAARPRPSWTRVAEAGAIPGADHLSQVNRHLRQSDG